VTPYRAQTSPGLILRSAPKERVSKDEAAPSFETHSLTLVLLRMRRIGGGR